MNNWQSKSTDALCDALVALSSREECYAFLEDACTIKEVLDIAQRLEVAKMLAQGVSYAVISKQTGASTATISRVSKAYEYGSGGYQLVLKKTAQK